MALGNFNNFSDDTAETTTLLLHHPDSQQSLTEQSRDLNETTKFAELRNSIQCWLQISTYQKYYLDEKEIPPAMAANVTQCLKWLIIAGIFATASLFSFGIVPAAALAIVFAVNAPLIATAVYSLGAFVAATSLYLSFSMQEMLKENLTSAGKIQCQSLLDNLYQSRGLMLAMVVMFAAAAILSCGLVPAAGAGALGTFMLAVKIAPVAIKIFSTLFAAISAVYAAKYFFGMNDILEDKKRYNNTAPEDSNDRCTFAGSLFSCLKTTEKRSDSLSQERTTTPDQEQFTPAEEVEPPFCTNTYTGVGSGPAR